MKNISVFQHREFRFAILLLFVVTLGVYLPTLNAGFIWDDDLYITQNPLLRNFAGLIQIWLKPAATPQYYPLAYTSFWLEYQLWGLWPLGYHLNNILLHASNAILLWLILHELAVPGAWLAAALFALHPVHVESVAWITERKNVLSGFFALAALLCYLRFAFAASNLSREPRATRRYYLAALFLFLCGLLSKTTVCSLPAVLFLVIWWKKERLHVQDILPLTPMFGLGLLLGTVTIRMETDVVGASGVSWDLAFLDRFLVAGRALWFYVGKLLWPHNLTFIYDRWHIDAAVWWQYLFPLGALAVIVGLILWQKQLGRGPLVATLVFSGVLFPALGFFNVYPMRYSYVADHFQYLASIAIITLVASLLWQQQSTTMEHSQGEVSEFAAQLVVLQRLPYRSFFSLLLLLFLGILTWHQGHVYENLETLWRDTLRKNPACWMAHNNLGTLATAQQDYHIAIDHFQAAASLNPQVAEPRSNLALAFVQVGRLDEAIEHGLQAISLQPEWSKSYSVVGLAFWKKGEASQALHYFRDAIQRKPPVAQAYYSLGALYLRETETLGDIHPRQAIIYLEQALVLQPDSVQTLHTLAWTLATHPDTPVRDGARAVALAEAACGRTGYQSPALLDTLAAAYAEAGRFAEAIAVAQRAVEHAHRVQKDELAVQIQDRIRLYQSGTPYHSHS
jgi:tetratricopeptide (TPR) repeat protein